MKPRNTLAVKGALTAGAVTLSLLALPAFADQPDGHAFVRDSIRNTWVPTAAASTEGKIDAHEQARTTIVGATIARSPERASGAVDGSRVGAHEQARRLLLAQPLASRQPVVASDRARPGS